MHDRIPSRGALAVLVLIAAPAAAEEPLGPTEGPIEGAGIVSGYTTDTAGHHSVNNYWLDGEDGIVAIDAHWRLSDAERALGDLRERTDKPIAALVLTHPHTDHFGGAPVFLGAGGDVAYYGSDWSTRSIANDEQGFVANRQDQFGEDFPAEVPLPDRRIEDGEPIEVAGLTIEPTILRQNEAVETVLLYLPDERALFTGDLVNHDTLPVLYQGGLDSWIAQLEGLRAEFPDAETIYPGHGAPGPFDELVERQIALLTAHRDLIDTALVDDGRVSDEEREGIADAIEEQFPDARTTAGIPARRQVVDQNVTWTLRGWRVAETAEGDAGEFRE